MRNFPIKCLCGAKAVFPAVIDHRTSINRGGTLWDIEVKNCRVVKCQACGEVLFSNDASDDTEAALKEAMGNAYIAPIQ